MHNVSGIAGCIQIQLVQQHIKCHYIAVNMSHTYISASSFQVSNLTCYHCWSTEPQHVWWMPFCAYLLKLYNALSSFREGYFWLWAASSGIPLKSYLMSHHPHRKQEEEEGVETETERKLSLFLPNCPRVTLLIPSSAARYGASLQAASSVLPGETHEKAMKGLVWQGPARLDQLTGFFFALTRHTAVCNSSMVWDLQTS